MSEIFDDTIRKPVLAYVPAWIRPNHVTILRAALLAPLVFFRSDPPVAVGLLILSSLCDILDGPLARVRGQSSQFGAFLDTVSDKVFVLGALFLACGDRVPLSVRVAITVLEALLVAARPIKQRLGARMDANAWGAAKTWAQSIGIAFILTRHPALLSLSPYVFGAAIFLAVLSLAFHARDIRNRKIS